MAGLPHLFLAVTRPAEWQPTAWERIDGYVLGAIVLVQLALIAALLVSGARRRRAEEAVLRSEALFRSLFEDHAAVKLVIDPDDGRIVDANDAAARFYGWPRARLKEMRIQDVNTTTPDEVSAAMEKVRRLQRTELALRHRLADGTIRDVAVYASRIRIGGRDLLHSVVHDVTNQRRAEEALRQAQRTLLMITLCNDAIIRATSEEELFRDVCRVVVETGGYQMSWVGVAEHDEARTVRPVAHAGREEGYLSAVSISWRDVPAGRGPTGTALREGRVVIGSDFTTSEALAPWREEATRRGYRSMIALPLLQGAEKLGVLNMYGAHPASFTDSELRSLRRLADDLAFGVQAIRDRSARERAAADREEALRQLSLEKDRFRALVDRSTDVTLVLDERWIIAYASPAVMSLLGRSPEETIGRPARDFVHPEDQARSIALLQELVGRPGATQRHELRIRRGDGGWATLEALRTNLLDVPAVRGIVVNARDITDRNRIREQLQQAQKLESIGRLAGGVAHDFNNLLTVILGSAEELGLQIQRGQPPVAERVDDVVAAAKRATDLTQQLLAFARKQVVAPVRLDLNELAWKDGKLLRRLIGEDVRVVERFQPGLWPVRCDPGLVDQLIMNLVVNARDAMPNGGTLTLGTSNLTLQPGDRAPDPEMLPGPYVQLTIQDTGTGMPRAVLEHIFEPFFTTKEPGKGTGLGLATVYGIVKQSNAFLRVRSEEGAGTTFDVFFPRDVQGAVPSDEETSGPVEGTETVLVVEDDARVRAATERMLRKGGYRVLTAGDGDEAVVVSSAEAGTIDLLVTDVVLPGRGGREVARTLAMARPGLRVLYVSGYTDDALTRNGQLEEGIDFLEKPFATAALLRRVREVLDRADIVPSRATGRA